MYIYRFVCPVGNNDCVCASCNDLHLFHFKSSQYRWNPHLLISVFNRIRHSGISDWVKPVNI